jgi:hypothetical protein
MSDNDHAFSSGQVSPRDHDDDQRIVIAPLTLTLNLTGAMSPTSARAGMSPRSVRFMGEEGSEHADPQDLSSFAPRPAKNTPLVSVAPTVGAIRDQLSELHAMITHAEGIAPLVKRDCHETLLAADRMLVVTTRKIAMRKEDEEAATAKLAENLRQAQGSDKKKELEKTKSAFGGGMAFATKASIKTDRDDAMNEIKAVTKGTDGKLNNGPTKEELDAMLAEAKAAEAKKAAEEHRHEMQLKRAWLKFTAQLKDKLNADEVALLSLPTIRNLMAHYGFEREPVVVAKIELYWRLLAQRREDARNAKALMHKQCAAVEEETQLAATRKVSKSFDGPTSERNQAAEKAGSRAPAPAASAAAAGPKKRAEIKMNF